MTFVPFQGADAIADRFLGLLDRLKINPPSGSEAEDELFSLTELLEVVRDPNRASGDDRVELLRRAAGLHDFAAKMLAAEELPEFKLFEPHLRLLANSSAPYSTLIQNARAPLPNDTNRKLTELYLASLVVHLTEELEIDSPSAADGSNPDVIFRYNGKRWALAVKSVSAQNGQTYFERIKEAAAQIDADSCDADVGMVVVNVKDAIDHTEIWAEAFPDTGTAIQALRTQVEEKISLAKQDRPQEEWDALFSGRAVRPVLMMAHSLAKVATPAGEETPTSLKAIVTFEAGGISCATGNEIASGLNHMMQMILTGTPAANGMLPG